MKKIICFLTFFMITITALAITSSEARYYDASTGRFISEDPSGHADGPNKFTYSQNNPVMLVDPEGQQTVPVMGGPTITPPIMVPPLVIPPANLGDGLTDAINDIPVNFGKQKNVQLEKEKNSGASFSSKKDNSNKGKQSWWQKLKNWRGKTKTSGKGRNKRYYEKDHTHNDVEVYDSKGRHLGSADPKTGNMIKGPKGYRINL